MRSRRETARESDKAVTRVERAIEADYYARRVGITKREAFVMLRDGNANLMPKEEPIIDPLAMFLAEHTDLSPNQAKDLIHQEGRNLHRLRMIARTMKAEG